MEFWGEPPGDLRAFHPVTYWGDTGSQQFYWFKNSGTVLCFCRNEGVCELYPDRAPDRIFAGIYPIFSSRLRNLEDFYPGKEQTERTVPYVASGRRIDIPGYLFSGTIALYNRDSSGDARNSITTTAYQHRDGSIYIAAGRGYTPDGMITPHLAAPGVNVKVPWYEAALEPAPEPAFPPHRPPASRHFCLNGPSYGITSRFYRKRREILSAERRKKRRKYAVPEPGVGVWEGESVSYV